MGHTMKLLVAVACLCLSLARAQGPAVALTPVGGADRCPKDCSGQGKCEKDEAGGLRCYCAPGFGGSACAVQLGSALRFNGEGNLMEVPAMDAAEDLTVEMWIYPKVLGGWRSLYSTKDWQTGSLLIQFAGADQLEVAVGGNKPKEVKFQYRFKSRTWHHVAVVYSRGRRMVQLVVNDKVEEQADFQDATLLNMKPAWLGGWQGGLRWFAGDIDELRVWNTARTPRQIRATAGMELEGKEENLLAYYKFNELHSKQAIDSSPNGNVGYLCGRQDPDKLSPDECAALCPSRVVQTEPIVVCPNDCGGKGMCIRQEVPRKGSCDCDVGYGGDDCTQKLCPENCNGNGLCKNGTCVCQPAFAGASCATKSCKNCSKDHGVCFDGTCTCRAGYGGLGCHGKVCPMNCSGRGSCEDGMCVCPKGWAGKACGWQLCENDCHGHGTCRNGTCVCRHGWYGRSCHNRACPGPMCMGNGKCNNGTCECKDEYAGADCSIAICPRNCSGRGACFEGQCQCDDGWAGKACEAVACPRDCSGHGDCGELGKCTCMEGYAGKDCGAKKTCPNNCNGHGKCLKGICLCDAHYCGNGCEISDSPLEWRTCPLPHREYPMGGSPMDE